MVDAPKPFWQTLRFILSNLIVLSYFLVRVTPESRILDGVVFTLDTFLIPMFVFIAAYLTQDISLKEIKKAVIPAIITCSGFQLINTIPAIIAGEFSLLKFFIEPLDGVWFIIAVPLWQGFSKMHAELRHHPVITMIIFSIIGFTAFFYGLPYSGLFSIVAYFPIFFLGRRITHEAIHRWRSAPIYLPLLLLAIGLASAYFGFIHYPHPLSFRTLYRLPLQEAIIYYLLFMSLLGMFGMVIIYGIRYLAFLESVAPKALGVYLIHPIICVIVLTALAHSQIALTLPVALFLTLVTIVVAVGLASIFPFNWLLAPKISHEEYESA